MNDDQAIDKVIELAGIRLQDATDKMRKLAEHCIECYGTYWAPLVFKRHLRP